jgi:type I restriction enzyme S subunit
MSFPCYPEHKESGFERLGLVPIDWDLYSLKRSVEGCVNGIWGEEADGENDLAVIRVADFQRSKLRIGTKKLTYRSITDKEKEARKLRVGDLLIEKSGGGDKTLVGCVVLFEHDFGAVSSNFVARMRPLPNFDSNFLCYAFDSLYKGRVNYPSIKQTTGIQNLDSESYLQERFCFPSLTEQTQIAHFLDHETAKIDTLIHEQKRLIELLKEKRQAVISHAVAKGLDPDVPMKDSGAEWLGEVPAHWGNVRLKHLVFEKVAGPYGSSLTKSMYVSSGYKVYGQQQVISDDFALGDYYISEEKFKELKRHEIHADDVLVSVMGTVGRVSVVPEEHEPGIINPRLVRYRFDQRRVLPQFVKAVLMSCLYQAKLSEASQGTTMEGLNMVILGEMPIVLPPVTAQQKIAEAVDSENSGFTKAINGSRDLVSLLQERRSALISAAVTGKIDVRNWQPPADESAFEEVARGGQEATA